MSTDINYILDLYEKPSNYQFSLEELKIIKKSIPKYNFEVRYCIYNKKSNKDMYITFVYDTTRNHPRRSGMDNQWEEICRRELTYKEYMEFVENFGTNNRRFKVFTYKYIDTLIEDDAKYGVTTPERFVNICKERGYFEKSPQLKLNL